MKDVRIPIDSDKSVGTASHPYKTSMRAAERRRAIVAGAADRHKRGMPFAEALMQVRRRLNAIRVVSKRQAHCKAIEADMRWLMTSLGVGEVTNAVCAPPAG